MTLGQRIVRELDPGDHLDTLERWMAHRVAELIDRAEQAPDEAAREAARRECTDVIMRLWQQRAARRRGRPLSEVSSFLDELAKARSAPFRSMVEVPESTWPGLMHRLNALNARERRICLDVAVTEIPVERERAWLTEHGEDMSDEERQIIECVTVVYDETESENYWLDGIRTPNFARLPPEERYQRALEALERIEAERRELIEAFRRAGGAMNKKTVAHDADMVEDENLPPKDEGP